MNTEKSKTCSKCLEVKHLCEFEIRPDSKDGYRKYCRSCKCKQHNIRLKIRHSLDKTLFWKIRANYLNKSSGRRNGIAKDIIKMSEPITFQELIDLYNVQNAKCIYCHTSLTKEDIVFDHKVPLSRKGEHIISNLCICCNDCNQLKGTKTINEFKTFIKEYISRFANTVLNF